MKYVVPLHPLAFLPVVDSTERYPVRRIYCVGRNYAAHAIEMGADPDREEPFFFQKNPDNLVINGENFPYPDKSIEGASDIAQEDANGFVWGYAVGVDMTRRDLQAKCKEQRRPWEVAKGFDFSAPCGALQPAERIGHPDKGDITLQINGELRQQGDLNQLIWKVPEVISYLSGLFRLHNGDIIMTGTPAGVGPVQRGDKLKGHIEGLEDLHCTVS